MPALKHQRSVWLALSLVLLCAQYAVAQIDAGGKQVNPRFGQVNAARQARVTQGSLRLTF